MILDDDTYENLIWRIDYIEKRIKEIDKEEDKKSRYYHAKTSAIYRVLLEDAIKDFKQIKRGMDEINAIYGKL
tara:strand:- start:458 stop:676 length:219 start_codon:yes stop_codon:yes gene_type:complete